MNATEYTAIRDQIGALLAQLAQQIDSTAAADQQSLQFVNEALGQGGSTTDGLATWHCGMAWLVRRLRHVLEQMGRLDDVLDLQTKISIHLYKSQQ